MMTHTVEKPYICKECYKTFSDKNNMVTHISTNLWTHTQHEKPYKCSTCYERFIQPNQLRGNMIIHTGVKPFICEFAVPDNMDFGMEIYVF